MKRWEKAVTAFFLGAQLLCVLTLGDFWPFVHYDMYAKPMPRLVHYEIYGVGAGGEELYLSPKDFFPLSYHVLLLRYLRARDESLAELLRVLKAHVNGRRTDTFQRLRLYIHVHPGATTDSERKLVGEQ